MLQWMYRVEITVSSNTELTDLLGAADYFQVAELKDVCSKQFTKKLTTATCLEVLNVACKYDLTDLASSCMRLFYANEKELLQQAGQTTYESIPRDLQKIMGLIKLN